MNELIAAGDPRTKVVGKRRSSSGAPAELLGRFDQLQSQFNKLWHGLPFETGVYRFKDWERFSSWKNQRMIKGAPGHH